MYPIEQNGQKRARAILLMLKNVIYRIEKIFKIICSHFIPLTIILCEIFIVISTQIYDKAH